MSNVAEKEIDGAGGLLWREGASEPEIMIVLRRDSLDWTFPKGQRRSDESLEQAATRNVEEETGVRTQSFGPTSSYSHVGAGAATQRVQLWHMTAAQEQEVAPADDILCASWVPVQSAMKLLSHADERAVLASSEPPSLRAHATKVDTLGSLISNEFTSPERKRLVSEVDLVRMKARRMQQPPYGLLGHARRSAEFGDIDTGWRFLHEARRRLYEDLKDHEIGHEALALELEADAKLRSWRKTAVKELTKIARDKDVGTETARSALIAAAAIRDESGDNTYFRNRLLRLQMSVISAWLLLLLGFFILLASLTDLGEPGIKTIPACAILGGMGACFSALLTFSKQSGESTIPATQANVLVTFTRPVVGAISGLVAVLVLKAGVATGITTGTVAAASASASAWLLPFAFGFSERLVVGALSPSSSDSQKS